MLYELTALIITLSTWREEGRPRWRAKQVKLEPPIDPSVGAREPPISVYREAGVVLGGPLYLAPAGLAPLGRRSPRVRSAYLSSSELASLSEETEKWLKEALSGGEAGEGGG